MCVREPNGGNILSWLTEHTTEWKRKSLSPAAFISITGYNPKHLNTTDERHHERFMSNLKTFRKYKLKWDVEMLIQEAF